MKKSLLPGLAVLLVIVPPAALSARAQETAPRYEIFGGGSWMRIPISPTLAPFGLAHIGAAGWSASATENVNRWLGGTFDFSGIYARPGITEPANFVAPGIPPAPITFSNELNFATYTFLFGPTFAYRGHPRLVPFGRFLVGGVNQRASLTSKVAALVGEESASSTRFSFAAGGGLDLGLSSHVTLRTAADWIHTTFPDLDTDRQENLRVTIGFAFRFGHT